MQLIHDIGHSSYVEVRPGSQYYQHHPETIATSCSWRIGGTNHLPVLGAVCTERRKDFEPRRFQHPLV